jgi:hypothetical protein
MKFLKIALAALVLYAFLDAMVHRPGRYSVTENGGLVTIADTATGEIVFVKLRREVIESGLAPVPLQRRLWPW